jgi:peptidylprolyl isomerase
MQGADNQLRAAAVLAAASVQDTTLIGSLIASLEDQSADVRRFAALSIGQLTFAVTDVQRALLSSVLLGRLPSEPDQSVQRRILEAIGKVGNAEALGGMVDVAGSLSTALQAEAALSVGRFGYRAIRSEQGTRFAASGLREDSGESWKSAYALMRIGVDSLLLPFLPAMQRRFPAADADTRMFLATAMGGTKSAEACGVLTAAAMSDRDWRVRVAATRALGLAGKSDSVVAGAILRLCADPNEHVSLTALTTLRSVDTVASTRGTISGFLARNSESVSSRQRGEAARTLASLFGASSATVLADVFADGVIAPDIYAECLGMVDDPGSFEKVVDFTRSEDVATRRAALDALDAMVRRNPDPAKREIAGEAFLSSLRSGDMTLVVTGAGALGDTMYAGPAGEKTLLFRLKTLSLPKDDDAIAAIIQALGALKSTQAVSPLEALMNSPNPAIAAEAAKALDLITGKSHAAHLPHRPPVYADYDWEYLRRLDSAIVEVQTSAGAFSFVMLPDEAPFTCINFARLIERGFFDGLLFHRVVPNFVIQGGDPRGDGWGGPGYSIRSEFGMENYDAGMVGVASSGKDTEGCQFFVTHSRQPHLDGRYTIFGRIVSGMEVVDRIQVRDTIEGMAFGTRNAEDEKRNREP